MGGNASIHTNVRVIAATNQDLDAMAAAGRFRQDLFYRLNVLTIRIPPLRERMDDIPLLVDYFLNRANRELGRHVRDLSPEAWQILKRHSWPGNVRELQSTIKFASIHATGDLLTADCLPAGFRRPSPAAGGAALDPGSTADSVAGILRRYLARGTPDLYYAIQKDVDRVVLDAVLKQVKGSQVEAAKILGISRTTLRAKLRTCGLAVEKQVTFETEEDGSDS